MYFNEAWNAQPLFQRERERDRERERLRVRGRERERERDREGELHAPCLEPEREAMKSSPVQLRQITPMGFQPSRMAAHSAPPPVVKFSWTPRGKQRASAGHEIGPRISIAFLLGAEDRAGKNPGTNPHKKQQSHPMTPMAIPRSCIRGVG